MKIYFFRFWTFQKIFFSSFWIFFETFETQFSQLVWLGSTWNQLFWKAHAILGIWPLLGRIRFLNNRADARLFKNLRSRWFFITFANIACVFGFKSWSWSDARLFKDLRSRWFFITFANMACVFGFKSWPKLIWRDWNKLLQPYLRIHM